MRWLTTTVNGNAAAAKCVRFHFGDDGDLIAIRSDQLVSNTETTIDQKIAYWEWAAEYKKNRAPDKSVTHREKVLYTQRY